MASWNQLPTEILQVIFKHLEEKKSIPSVPRRHLYIASKDLAQCQLTCKNWTRLAQSNLYTSLELANLLQLRSFVDTLITQNQLLGLSIENISFIFRRDESYDIDIFDLISKIVCFCPDLKGLYTNFATCIGLWNCIQTQKSKGFFPNLEFMTRPQHAYHQIPEYNIAAYSIKETLRELTIYCSQLELIEPGEKKLEHFINLNTLYFILHQTSNVYTIHQQIQRCSSVKWVDIAYKTFAQGENQIIPTLDESSHIHDICPNVRKFCIRGIVFDKQLPEYMMKIFPNLDTVDLNFKLLRNPDSPLLDKLSTNDALRFLSFLLKMKSVNVSYIPIEDVDDVMIHLQGIHNNSSSIHQHLDITYTYDRRIKGPTYLKLSTTEINLNLQVIHNSKRQIIFPQMGLIMGTYSRLIQLKSIRMNMGMQPEMMKAGAYISNNEANLYHIFHRYPHLESLHILNTPLDTFGTTTTAATRLKLQKRFALRNLTLERSLIGPDLLESLSFHTYRIATLTIRDSMLFFMDDDEDFPYTVCIHMPDTEFNRIDFYESRRRRCDQFQVGLNLKKIRDDSTTSCWFLGNDGKFETCTEEVYNELQRTHSLISFVIQCADISAIHLYLNKNQLILEF
ncbi:hypothetical protein BD770DRAFT_385735 [Pilaira anomala]|nr:hypothetical protein BD770DRAFT_385735 [Pilaira anomala]